MSGGSGQTGGSPESRGHHALDLHPCITIRRAGSRGIGQRLEVKVAARELQRIDRTRRHGGIGPPTRVLERLPGVMDEHLPRTQARYDLGHRLEVADVVEHAHAIAVADPALRRVDRADVDLRFAALQAKDVPSLQQLVVGESAALQAAFLALPDLYGKADTLPRARAILPDLPEIATALAELERVGATVNTEALGFDLADLRGYHYHSGVSFAAYCAGQAQAIAVGGRYDEVGKCFGRARPATGFSLDLRQLARQAPQRARQLAICAPYSDDQRLNQEIRTLRAAGEIVVVDLPGHEADIEELACDRQLEFVEGEWQIVPLDRKV